MNLQKNRSEHHIAALLNISEWLCEMQNGAHVTESLGKAFGLRIASAARHFEKNYRIGLRYNRSSEELAKTVAQVIGLMDIDERVLLRQFLFDMDRKEATDGEHPAE